MNRSFRALQDTDAVCILEQAEKNFQIGIVGTGPGFESMIELMGRPELEEYFPRLHLVACMATELSAQWRARLAAMQVAVYDDFTQMLAAHPTINLIVELTGQQEFLKAIRQTTPPHVSILDHTSAVFLCGLLIMSEVTSKCKIDLLGSRTLLNTIMDEIPDDIFFLDQEGQVLDVNRNACIRLGMERDELLGKKCWVVPAGPDQVQGRPDMKDHPFRATLEHGQQAESLQTWVDGQGRAHYFRVITYPVLNEDRQLDRVIMIRRDVTLRTEMEKRLQQAEKLAAIGELSTYIAHEIRNPLFAIGGFANALLRSSDLTENIREKVRIILEESKRLDTILRSILNFARPITPAIGEVDANTVVNETMRVLGMGFEDQDIILVTLLRKDVPNVRGDMELLKQCLINLVKNAIEAMPEGGVLTITTKMEQQHVVLTVEDTGQGIPEDIQDKIFNPFFTTKKGGGSGLGLAMTKKIISDLGGDVQLESQPGKGTRVRLFLQPFASLAAQ